MDDTTGQPSANEILHKKRITCQLCLAELRKHAKEQPDIDSDEHFKMWFVEFARQLLARDPRDIAYICGCLAVAVMEDTQ